MEIIKRFRNLMGEITGFQECVLCKNRSNWKDFIILNFDETPLITDKIMDYNPPICVDCFKSHHIDDIIHAIKKDIADINNFTRRLRYAPFYTDFESETIVSAIKSMKEATP